MDHPRISLNDTRLIARRMSRRQQQHMPFRQSVKVSHAFLFHVLLRSPAAFHLNECITRKEHVMFEEASRSCSHVSAAKVRVPSQLPERSNTDRKELLSRHRHPLPLSMQQVHSGQAQAPHRQRVVESVFLPVTGTSID